MEDFQEIHKLLVTAPVLAIPDLNKPFQVHTDASVVGTGGVLMQESRVASYTSSKFAPAEFNYGTPEQELLGLVAPPNLQGAHKPKQLLLRCSVVKFGRCEL